MKVYVDADDDAPVPERHFRADCPALLGLRAEARDAADQRPTRRCEAGCWEQYEGRRRAASVTEGSSIRDAIVQPLMRHKWFFAGVVAVLLLVALIAVFQRNRLYQSQATVSVYPRKGVPLFSGYQDYSSVVLGTYAELLQSRNFLAGI